MYRTLREDTVPYLETRLRQIYLKDPAEDTEMFGGLLSYGVRHTALRKPGKLFLAVQQVLPEAAHLLSLVAQQDLLQRATLRGKDGLSPCTV